MIGFPCLVVELASDLVHSRDDCGNTGGVLQEKEGCIFVLLWKGVSLWVDNLYNMNTYK